MEPPLSVLLPVRNCQATLSATAERLLEVLGELDRRFELVIIDDGSTDATIEVADELAACYPQVSAIRHNSPLGRAAAIRTGLGRSSGRIVLLEDAQDLPDPGKLHHLWGDLESGGPRSDGGYRKAEPAPEPRNSAASRPKRPNYLAKLREFAVGE